MGCGMGWLLDRTRALGSDLGSKPNDGRRALLIPRSTLVGRVSGLLEDICVSSDGSCNRRQVRRAIFTWHATTIRPDQAFTDTLTLRSPESDPPFGVSRQAAVNRLIDGASGPANESSMFELSERQPNRSSRYFVTAHDDLQVGPLAHLPAGDRGPGSRERAHRWRALRVHGPIDSHCQMPTIDQRLSLTGLCSRLRRGAPTRRPAVAGGRHTGHPRQQAADESARVGAQRAGDELPR